MNLARPSPKGATGLLLFVAFGLLFCHRVVSNEVSTRPHDATVIGIDLGSVHSRVAYGNWDGSEMNVASDVRGNRFIPSCVAFTADGPLIGEAAQLWAMDNPETTICDPKALLGRRSSDQDVDALIKHLPYNVLSDHQDKLMYKINVGGHEKAYTPEYVTSLIMRELRHMAGDALGNSQNVTRAVVVVPTYFNGYQKQAIKDAGKLAGLDVVSTIKESVAISVAYGLDHHPYDEHNVVVFDIGDTLDVSVLNVEQEVFDVLATLHHDAIGGKEVNKRIMKHFVEIWKEKTGIDLTGDPFNVIKLRLEVEKAKIVLSSKDTTVVNLDFVHPTLIGSLTRSEFEDIIGDLFGSFMRISHQVLADANLSISDIDDVVVAGGMGAIPMVREAVQRVFSNHTIIEVLKDEAAIVGAAQHGGLFTKPEETSNCHYAPGSSPLNLGIETADGMMANIAPRNPVPFSTSWNFTTAVDGQSSMMIRLLEGERVVAANNLIIGEFELPLTPAKAGVSRVEIVIAVDADGVVRVRATDLVTRRNESIIITPEKAWARAYMISSNIFSDRDFLASWPDSDIDPDLELRAQVNARVDFESYLTTLKQRLIDREVWGSEDIVRYDKLGHPLQRNEILRDIEKVQDDLIKYRDAWEPDHFQELKEAFSYLAKPFVGKLDYELVYKVGGRSRKQDGEL
ncbi:HSP70-domain-containing protein [Xylaria cf. heliscus]|nr:HSP70-domain-containing protein [Xylaria cf. heliscus]